MVTGMPGAGRPSAGQHSAGPPSAGPPSAGPPSAGPPSAGRHGAGLLGGLRVLDLTRFVAGSQATMLLAAMGADVLKIEVPPGDPYRWQGTERSNGESVLFMALNSGKRSVAVDFRRPAG